MEPPSTTSSQADSKPGTMRSMVEDENGTVPFRTVRLAMNWIGFVLLGICFALAGAGCGTNPEPKQDAPVASPVSDVKLRLLVVGDPAMATTIDQLRGEWNSRDGGQLSSPASGRDRRGSHRPQGRRRGDLPRRPRRRPGRETADCPDYQVRGRRCPKELAGNFWASSYPGGHVGESGRCGSLRIARLALLLPGGPVG